MTAVKGVRRFEALLREERVTLLRLLDAQPTAEPEPGGPLPTHPAEAARSLVDHEEALSVRTYLLERLAEVGAAQLRIRDGTYGRCEVCGTPINAARLQIIPTARMRVECQERVEHEPRRLPRGR